MTSTATSKLSECDCLHLHTSPPHGFQSEQVELVHSNEQISALDNHISQLNSLRRSLHRRSCRLYNLFVPIHTLPVEVLSCILQQAVHLEDDKYKRIQGYHNCLRQAFLLSSVSAHFRHAAFCTPELWRRIPLRITVAGAIGKTSSLLRHCVALAARIKVAIDDQLEEEEAITAVETLLTSDVTRNIKAVELFSRHASNIWIAKLKDSSVRYLHIDNIPIHALVSIFYQCPNLEECFARGVRHHRQLQVAQFDRPLTLAHLKRLELGLFNVTMTPSSAQNLRLPLLEYLRYTANGMSDYTGLLLLCRNVSATLMILEITLLRGRLEYDDLYQLCGLPFPNLRELGFVFAGSGDVLTAIRALTQRAEECSMAQLHYLPSLAALTLRHSLGELNPLHRLLGLLKKWRIGETSYFHLELKRIPCLGPGDGSWIAGEEWRSVVGNRKIEVTWDGKKVQ